ncbi:PREDICTED: putative F-box protein At4g22660-like [Fragaria vesca subsp. vesca]
MSWHGYTIYTTEERNITWARKMMEESKWHELPVEVLELIMNKIASMDILRFEAVCSSWKLAAKSYVASPYYNPLPQTPWLMLRNNQEDKKSWRFFSLEEKRVYTIKNVFEGFQDDWCVGSSHGWLLIMDSKAVFNLVNPIARATIGLPDIQTLPEFTTNFSGDHIFKTAVSLDPSRNKNFVMALLATRPSRLAFYKHEDKTWKSLELGKVYEDIIFHHGQLYALRWNGEVAVWDFKKPLPVKTTYLQNSAYVGSIRASYLVESLGDILQVQRILQKDMFGDSYITSHFRVFRMNITTANWERLESLGERILFWGRHGSITSSALDFTELNENSIYHYDNGTSHNVGAYSLTQKNMEPVYKFEKWRTDRVPFWIVPDLCLSYSP